MRKKPMNFRLILALDGLALLAIIGAVQVVRWACSWLAVALAYWGGWDIAEAAHTDEAPRGSISLQPFVKKLTQSASL